MLPPAPLTRTTLALSDRGHSQEMQRIESAKWHDCRLLKAHIRGLCGDRVVGWQGNVLTVRAHPKPGRAKHLITHSESRDAFANGFDLSGEIPAQHLAPWLCDPHRQPQRQPETI